MCCAASGYNRSEINGECSECGAETIDGDAYENCSYSPSECNVCDYAPCTLAC